MKIKSNTFFFLIFIIITFYSCHSVSTSKTHKKSTSFTQNLFNSDALLQHVKLLSSDAFEGRKTGTRGSKKARDYIISEFKKLHVLPFNSLYEHPFLSNGANETLPSVNVLGYIKGHTFTKQYMVVSAHYDHEGIKNGKLYNGADDNASGVSALFAFAEYLEKHPPKHSIILAAFDAEEIGLQGAYHFVESSKNQGLDIVFNINMDMISRSKAHKIYAIGQLSQPELQPIIASVKLPDNFYIAKGYEGHDGKRNWLYASDHAAFYESGIPVLYFGVEDHKDYHKPTDDFERIHPDFYIKSVYTIISIFKKLDVKQL